MKFVKEANIIKNACILRGQGCLHVKVMSTLIYMTSQYICNTKSEKYSISKQVEYVHVRLDLHLWTYEGKTQGMDSISSLIFLANA